MLRPTPFEPLENMDEPLIERVLRCLLAAYDSLQAVLKTLEQVEGHFQVTAIPLLSLDQLPPADDQQFALGNAPIGLLQPNTQVANAGPRWRALVNPEDTRPQCQ